MFRRRRPLLGPLVATAALVVAIAGVPGVAASEWELPCADVAADPAPPSETATVAEPPPPCAETAIDLPAPPPEVEPEPMGPEGDTTTTAGAPRRAQAKAKAKVKVKAGSELDDAASAAADAAGFRVARAPLTVTPPLGAGPYVFPVVGSASFTDTWGAARATVAWHHGVDVFAPLGAPVVAVADGTVLTVGWNRIGGWRLWLRDRDGNYFYYAHLSAFSPLAVEGTSVRAGAVLGFVGNTGDAVGTPYHLHFEIHPVSLLSLGYDGAVNPTPYVSTWQRLDAASDLLSLAGFRWGAGLVEPARRAVAPPAGAMLLGYTDIASGGELSDAADAPVELDDSLELAAEPERADGEGSSVAAAPEPFDPAHVRVVRLLEDEAAQPAQYTGGVWDRLAECEASGDWDANTGNGFFGGLQFHPHTWLTHGGGEYAPTADGATREQQIAVAARVLGTQGWNAWPVCSRNLGLR